MSDWEEKTAQLVHPLQKSRAKVIRGLSTWLNERPASERTFENLKNLFHACCTTLYLTDGLKEQRLVSIEVVKLTRHEKERSLRFACLLSAICSYWRELDSHRVPKFLLLVRILVAEFIFQLRANKENEQLVKEMFATFALIMPVCKLPTDVADGSPEWLLESRRIGVIVPPAVWLQVVAVWMEELQKQVGGRIYISSASNKKEAPEGVQMLSQHELMVMLNPWLKNLATKRCAENVWRRTEEVLLDLIENEEMFADEESRQCVLYVFARSIEAIAAAGLIHESNEEIVNRVRKSLLGKSGYEGEEVESDAKGIWQWAKTHALVSFFST